MVGLICDLQVKNFTPNVFAIPGASGSVHHCQTHHPRGAVMSLITLKLVIHSKCSVDTVLPCCLLLFLPNVPV